MHYQPVCGRDGKTYGNSCTATCRGVEVAYKGECKPPSSETQSSIGGSSDVDSSSGTGGLSSTDSSAKPACVCAKLYAPVCGANSRTYSNACEAKCAGMRVEATGPCPDSSAAGTVTSTSSGSSSGSVTTEAGSCKCDKTYSEVCGADGKTYGNACLAVCAGSKVASEGPCKVPGAAAGAAPKPSKLARWAVTQGMQAVIAHRTDASAWRSDCTTVFAVPVGAVGQTFKS
jgi:hypothetical protein